MDGSLHLPNRHTDADRGPGLDGLRTSSNGNSFYLGVDVFLAQIPIVLFALVAGVLADRRDRRAILLSSQYAQMACALVMATLAFTGLIQVWHIWVLSFIVGSAQAFGGPSYSALIPTLVLKSTCPTRSR